MGKLAKIEAGTEIIKIKLADLEVECSEEYATHFLERFLRTKETNIASSHLVEHPSLPPSHSLLPLAEKHRSRRFGFIAAMLVLVMAAIITVGVFTDYKKRQRAFMAQHKMAQAQNHAYRQLLAENLDSLLGKLDELTSSSASFRKAFPDVTALVGIARTKRGPDLADKAEATQEFIALVKQYFDSWSARPQDFTPDMRPSQGDVARFLSAWKVTEVLLASLKAPSSS